MSAHSVHSTGQKPPARVFFAAFVVIFFCTISAGDSIGFVPCQLDGTCIAAPASDSIALASLPVLGEPSDAAATPRMTLPVRIKIDSVGIDLPVQNPSTTDVDALDALLQNGPARYVRSAQLGEDGNVLIFAHSSHLPIVHNQMFKAFNNILAHSLAGLGRPVGSAGRLDIAVAGDDVRSKQVVMAFTAIFMRPCRSKG